MIYFFGILLWISPASVDIQAHKNSAGLDRSLLALVVLEKFHLAQALFGFCARLVRAAKVFAFLLRDHFVAVFYFLDHMLPSCANFARATLRCQYHACCRASRQRRLSALCSQPARRRN